MACEDWAAIAYLVNGNSNPISSPSLTQNVLSVLIVHLWTLWYLLLKLYRFLFLCNTVLPVSNGKRH